MCLQDMRIQAGLRFRGYTGVASSDGFVPIPNLNRAYMVTGTDVNNSFSMSALIDGTTEVPIPPDLTLCDAGDGIKVYTHRCYSGFAPGSVLGKVTGGDWYAVYVWEWDAEVDAAISRSLLGGSV